MKRLIDVLTVLGALVGLALSTYNWFHSKNLEIKAAAESAYRELDRRYLDFEKLCLDHPRLDCADEALPRPYVLSAEEGIQQATLYFYLFELFEDAYSQYDEMRTIDCATYTKDWPSWDKYIGTFVARPAFQTLWNDHSREYDPDFGAYMARLAARTSVPSWDCAKRQ